MKRIIRERPLGTPPGPEIQVESSIRCTRTSTATTLDHLTVRAGRLEAYEGEPWEGEIVTLAECTAGERVFAEMFVDVSAPRLWDLIEIVE